MPSLRRAAILVALSCAPAVAQQPLDSAYTAQIRALTPSDERWKFTTEFVDHLPASATVPTPLKVLGYVPGTPGKLSKVDDLNRYFRALAAASPRVKLFSLGMSDEGREMIVLAIGDESDLAKLDQYKANAAKLADPRTTTPEERERLIRDTKPFYWLTGSIHSPETGSPEMLMELAYRLAVEESEQVRAIRANVVVLVTPVTEVDGRDRVVDTYQLSKSLKLGPQGVNLLWWGKYTAHDNNRDGMVLSQTLTRRMLAGFLEWHPMILHDLHESVPFLYVSTGTGPYNDEFDPIVVDEWHTLAYQEITELTRRGLPGVWTHGFYDGWTPNYLFTMANFHNAIGRFYETYTSQGADCHTVKLARDATERRWDRPNPPVNGIKWCIRSNINYQQSGLLVALRYVADHRETFVRNFSAKSERMVLKGKTQAPYAFVLPRGQRHAAEAADLVNLFRQHGAEVHVADADATLMDGKVEVKVQRGDWVVRMDQPYTQMVRTLLARQRYKVDDPPPYDDTGWTIDELRGVSVLKIADAAILSLGMTKLTAEAKVDGVVQGGGATLVIAHTGDWRSAALPWHAGAPISVADSAFAVGGISYPAGTWLADAAKGRIREAVKELGLTAIATDAPAVRSHQVTPPRIALVHTWINTQDEGWVRYAFDQLGVPYTYLSDQKLKVAGALDKFDVIVFPHVGGPVQQLINGRPMTGPAIPWRKSALTPSLDKWDQTDDMRPAMGLEGAAALRRFVERGGLLLVEGNTANVPVTLGFNPTVSVASTRALNARGGIYRAQLVGQSPITYGYSTGFPVYFNQSPLMQVQPKDTTGRLDAVDPAIVAAQDRERARVVLRMHEKGDSLLVSGLLAGGDEMAGKAVVVDAPVGQGHVVLFGIRPMWRWHTQGSFALVLNALAHWNRLDAPPAAPPPASPTATR